MKLELLNSENASSIFGGKADCTAVGDTIFKKCFMGTNVIVKWCATYEASCSGTFSFQCVQIKDIDCSESVSLKPLHNTISR